MHVSPRTIAVVAVTATMTFATVRATAATRTLDDPRPPAVTVATLVAPPVAIPPTTTLPITPPWTGPANTTTVPQQPVVATEPFVADPPPLPDVTVPAGWVDVPVVAVDAYQRAAAGAPCKIPAGLLAAVGATESGHGTFKGATLTTTGETTTAIVGPRLRFKDSDGGRYDGDTERDRAVGPMQFIPTTWAALAADGNGDGVTDPHNIYDAAAAAARLLCDVPGDLRNADGLRAALWSYNRSHPYAQKVVERANRYGARLPALPVPATEPAPVPADTPADPATPAP